MTRPARLALLSLLAAGVGRAQPVEQIRQPIFFGQRDPGSITLSEGQRLAIGWLHAAGAPGSQFCTGNVITPDVVLTTRHCFDQALDNTVEFDPIGAAFSVGLGPFDVTATVDIIDSVFHPHRDLVLLRLAEPITDLAPVEPLPLITTPLADSLAGSTAEAAGHGRTEAEAEKVGLFFVSLPITCVDEHYVEVFGGGTRGICSGDSGGPLLVRQADGRVGILGIEHQGDRSCVGRDYLVRMDRNIAWIDDALGRLQGRTGIDRCNGLTYRGRCVADRVEWCDGDAILFQECGPDGLVCGLLDPQQGIFCRPPAACEGEGALRCAGGVLLSCAEGVVTETDCVTQGKVCVTPSEGKPYCVARCGVTMTDTVDDGAGPFRRPGEAVVFKGVFDINCAAAPGARGGPWGLLLLALAWRRRSHPRRRA